MSDFLIQQETMEGIANQVRRISNTEGLYTASEILELLSKLQGTLSIASSGDIVIEAIDYDGTILKTANLSKGQIFALPTPPVHDGLIFQGWTAPTASSTFVNADSVNFSIGAFYSTVNGATEFDVITTEANQRVQFPFVIGKGKVDYGDGEISEYNNSSSGGTIAHTYTTPGNYTMKFYNTISIDDTSSEEDKTAIVAARLSDTVTTLSPRAFINYSNLSKISLSKNIELLNSYSLFYECSSLKAIIFPPKLTEISGNQMFYNCSSLERIILPENLKIFGGDKIFVNCSKLKTLILPKTIEIVKEKTNEDSYSYGTNVNGTYLEENLRYFPTVDNKRYVLSCASLPTLGTMIDIIIPDDVHIIQDGAFFSSNTGLINKLVISNNVKKIPKRMCYTCNPEEVVLPDGLIEVGDYAFYDGYFINNINIPDSIKHIGNYAFHRCNEFNITIPPNVEYIGNYGFYGCNILNFNIPPSLTEIGSYAFASTNLTNVKLPSTIKKISNGLFQYCSELESADLSELNIDDSTEIYLSYMFSYCTNLVNVILPDSLTKIYDSMFRECTSLTNLDFLNSSITDIQNSAFWGCTGLTKVVLPSGITKINDDVFNSCTNITEIILPSNLLSIEEDAFSGCTSLAEITLPDSLTKLSVGAFRKCTSLKSLHIPANVTSILNPVIGCSNLEEITVNGNNYIVRDGMLFTKYGNEVLAMTKDAIIPSDGSVIGLGSYLFYKDKDLTEYIVPEGIKRIGNRCFSNCTSLENITLPNTLKYIDDYAFSDCSSLTSITIPKSVESIDWYAFDGCRNLTSAIYEGTEEEWANVTVGTSNESLTNVLTFTPAT